MSVVAAKILDNKIIMASDSIVIHGGRKDQAHLKAAKMCKINGMIIGSCGELQESSLFQAYCGNHKPEGTRLKDMLDFLVEFKKWLKDQFAYEKSIQNQYLIAYDSTLWSIWGLDVNEIKDFYAIGAGEDYALAAMHLGKTPYEAVKVACEMNCYVAEPIVEEGIEVNHRFYSKVK